MDPGRNQNASALNKLLPDPILPLFGGYGRSREDPLSEAAAAPSQAMSRFRLEAVPVGRSGLMYKSIFVLTMFLLLTGGLPGTQLVAQQAGRRSGREAKGATGAAAPLSDTTRRSLALRRVARSRFLAEQLKYARVAEARATDAARAERLFERQGIPYPAALIYIRIFKREHQLELWARALDRPRYRLVKTYDICALAGELGPKRRQGDEQTPEGFYEIDAFNPASQYHLSLHVSYPNAADVRSRGPGIRSLGGEIFIHGGCRTAGCIAVTDANIRELYWIAAEIHAAGQDRIPVHIFPSRLTDLEMAKLDKAFSDDPEARGFWRSLKPGYDYFQDTHQLPQVDVDWNGEYRLATADYAPPAELFRHTTPAGGIPRVVSSGTRRLAELWTRAAASRRTALNDLTTARAAIPDAAKVAPPTERPSSTRVGAASPAARVTSTPRAATRVSHAARPARARVAATKPVAKADTSVAVTRSNRRTTPTRTIPRVVGTPVDFPIKPGSLKNPPGTPVESKKQKSAKSKTTGRI